jgi:hypothetical protein
VLIGHLVRSSVRRLVGEERARLDPTLWRRLGEEERQQQQQQQQEVRRGGGGVYVCLCML